MASEIYWLNAMLCLAIATSTIVVAVQAQHNAQALPIRRRELRFASTDEVINYRLPTAVQPVHYKVLWHPDLQTGIFTGQETIELTVEQATKQIILHAHKLIVSNVYVRADGGSTSLEVANYELDTVRQFLIIEMMQELQANVNITLGLNFEGHMLNKIEGLYSSNYKTSTGEQRTIATTKFEPVNARQGFPCFDEPAMKATFEISVIHPTGAYHALSNMNIQDSQLLSATIETIFASSVTMSTYLVCIIVSDFTSEAKTVITKGIGSDFEMRVFAAPHQQSKVNYALEFGVAVTEYYIQYYKVPYPLPKLDMAAIPDFASNAMEHWGLITYRETALLYDEDYSSTWNKQSIASVLAHEIAHMWFGNLVTMKWWNDIWLNEGFARYMQYKGVHAVCPNWGMLEQFQIICMHSVLAFDDKLSSHPIVQTVETPSEISAIFDTISYDKGGSVIRMLEYLVGAESFEQAVTNYLVKHQFSNAVTEDFITEVAAVVGTNTNFDVKLLFSTWTEQMGYPVLNVVRSSDLGFTITQNRFLSNKASYNEFDPETSKFNYKWSVPVTYFLDTSIANSVTNMVFSHDEDKVGIAVESNVKWIKLNVHQVGYYRVNYETSIWQLLIQELLDQPTRFDVADRAHLLNDAFALANAGQLSFNLSLDLTAYLAKEYEFVPWYVAAQSLKQLRRQLMYTESYVEYLKYAREVVNHIYQTVGWNVDAENHLKNRLRATIVSTACELGLPDCLKEAAHRFNSWLAAPTLANTPAPDLRETVYFYGMQQSQSELVWEHLLDVYKNEQDASERAKLMYGLSAVQDAQLLYRLIDLAADESYVRAQDFFTCLEHIAANPVGEPLVWLYYRENWPALVERFQPTNKYLGRLISSITKHFASQVKLEELQQFIEKYPVAGASEGPRKEALQIIKYNIQWLEQNSSDIANWLKYRFAATA